MSYTCGDHIAVWQNELWAHGRSRMSGIRRCEVAVQCVSSRLLWLLLMQELIGRRSPGRTSCDGGVVCRHSFPSLSLSCCRGRACLESSKHFAEVWAVCRLLPGRLCSWLDLILIWTPLIWTWWAHNNSGRSLEACSYCSVSKTLP